MFCMQMPPINLDFQNPFFGGLGAQEFFQESLARWPGFDGLQN